jgi:hypothetical protein
VLPLLLVVVVVVVVVMMMMQSTLMRLTMTLNQANALPPNAENEQSLTNAHIHFQCNLLSKCHSQRGHLGPATT